MPSKPDVVDVPELEEPEFVFGELKEGETLPDLSPIPIDIVGYMVSPNEDGENEKVKFRFHVQRQIPFGSLFDMLTSVNPDGSVPDSVTIAFLYDCIVSSERELLRETLHRDDVHFTLQMLVDMSLGLAKHYNGGNPTLPRSARRAGSRRTGPTSRVAHSGRVSTSKR